MTRINMREVQSCSEKLIFYNNDIIISQIIIVAFRHLRLEEKDCFCLKNYKVLITACMQFKF